ncbi:MAG: hypothetical protein E7L17_05790 [Clostridium sp.]|uniref:hypothetical protein n=1 Tax=Clostridium sp. TaxID=1506 RepID=UPI0029100D8A|nr:hypothetical protein [Clostridium sp.]MDU7337611.1 hypothetical protein [Clostridium sp.]
MSRDEKAVLKSKLAVYTACYQQARKTKDHKRMVLLDTIMNDLKNEISMLVN